MARDITELHPDLQVIITKFLWECNKKGFKVGIADCVRTVEEQNALYAKGRTVDGKIVTKAKGSSYSSMHQWGVAFDFYRKDGKGAYNESGNFFYKVGQIGKKYGLFWGGDFKSISDKSHFQMKEYSLDGTTGYLKKKYGTPSWFMHTWKKKVLIVKPVRVVNKTYKVKKGDTLSVIATKYKTTVEKLVDLNNIENADKIYIGQKIKIK